MALGAGVDTGQGFLTDYSALSGAGAAFQGFAGAYKDAQDQQMKRQELQSKIMAQQQQMTREATEQALKLKTAGQTLGPGGPTDLQEAPLGPRERASNQIKAISGGAMEGTPDASGNPNYVPNPDYWRAMNAQNMMGIRQQGLDNQGKRLQLQQSRFGETQSQNAAKAGQSLETDKLIQDMSTARYSLSRGKSLLTGNMPLTYNNLNAVQQDVINGMTAAGQSSEGKVSREMQESWIGKWNDLKAKASQYGENNDIRKQDPGLAKQIGGLLDEVDSTVGQNMADRKKHLASSYGQTSNAKVRATIDQKLKEDNTPQGLMSPGLVKPAAGLVAPGQQQAAPKAKPKTVIQNGHTYTLNPATGGYE